MGLLIADKFMNLFAGEIDFPQFDHTGTKQTDRVAACLIDIIKGYKRLNAGSALSRKSWDVGKASPCLKDCQCATNAEACDDNPVGAPSWTMGRSLAQQGLWGK